MAAIFEVNDSQYLSAREADDEELTRPRGHLLWSLLECRNPDQDKPYKEPNLEEDP